MKAWRTLVRVLVVAAAVINVTKSLPTNLQIIGWTQYQITYHFGFVRRGLVGTLYQAVTEGPAAPEMRQRQVLGIHVLLVGALIGGVLLWYRHSARRANARKPLLEHAAAAFLLAPAIPTLLVLAGYLDVYLAGATLVAAWALRRKNKPLLLGASIVAPFIHDAFIYWWLTVVGLALVETSRLPRKERVRELAWLAAPFVLFPAIMLLHTSGAVEKLAAALQSPDSEKQNFIDYTFNISVGRALPMMVNKFRLNLENVGLSALYTLPMSVWLAVTAVRALPAAYRSRQNRVLVALASLAPSAVLMVAWDLSRLLSWSAISGAIVVGYCADLAAETDGEATATPLPMPWRIGAGAVLAAAAAIATGPLVFTYFEVAFPSAVFLPPALNRNTPVVRFVEAFSAEYNRKVLLHDGALADRCNPGRDRATKIDGEKCAFHVTEGGIVDLGDLRLAPGHYRAKAMIRVPSTCPKTTGSLDTLSWWRYIDLTATKPFEFPNDDTAHEVDTPFDVSRETVTFGTVVIRARAATGCIDVLDMRVEHD